MEQTTDRPRRMIYATPDDWRKATRKRVLLFGMSGLGKTHVSNLLRASGNWFHYSVDYRIGTRYMGEYIVDNFKREAMRAPFLRHLLMTDSIYIASNITFSNLAPLSTYLGKPGDRERGGLPFAEYSKRQEQHRVAERAALADTLRFIDRAKDLYDYDHFVCDSGGSICEVVDPWDPADPLLTMLSSKLLMIWIEGDEAHRDALVARFARSPKPMCYAPEFLDAAWAGYLAETGLEEDAVDPDAFMRHTFARALDYRQPRYAAMAAGWGLKVSADAVAQVRDAADFDTLVADALAAHGP